jgi:hypothetical protein
LNIMFAKEEMPSHYYPDTADNSMYWFFTVLSWVPCYLIVYVGPYLF